MVRVESPQGKVSQQGRGRGVNLLTPLKWKLALARVPGIHTKITVRMFWIPSRPNLAIPL